MAEPYPNSPVESEQETFFKVLLHDDRGSHYIVSTDASGSWKDAAFKRDDLERLVFNSRANYYVTHNGFDWKRRQTERVRQLNALFFDLDCHGANELECDMLTDQAIVLIEKAVSVGTLPRPNLVVASGRGIHVYYVLERSIPFRCKRGGEKNEKGIALFKRVQAQLADVLAEVIAELHGMTVDQAVFDVTRVARIPGTFNTRAHRYAFLVFSWEGYYHLPALAFYKPSKQESSPSSGTRKPAIILNYQPLMMARLNKLMELQEYRGFDCEGTRELMCFVFYNTAVQIYSRSDAAERLKAFNGRFKKALPPSELDGVTKTVDEVVNVRGEKGHYILKAESLVRLLALTKEEMDELNFFASKRLIERMEAKRKTKERREARNQRIASLYRSGKTQREVAAMVGCCLRTVQSVLKALGISKRVFSRKPSLSKGQGFHASTPVTMASWSRPAHEGILSSLDDAKNCLTSYRSFQETGLETFMRPQLPGSLSFYRIFSPLSFVEEGSPTRLVPALRPFSSSHMVTGSGPFSPPFVDCRKFLVWRT